MWRMIWGAGLGAVLAGCSSPANLIFPHADVSQPPPQSGECSLEHGQARKMLPRAPGISGIATPFVVRDASQPPSDKVLHGGQWVSFSLSERGAGAPPPALWRLEPVESAGTASASDAPLNDGDIVRLRNDHGYLILGSGARTTRVPTIKGTPLIVVKADVPDRTRRTTCDDQVRDGDFVFLRTLAPNVWIGASAAGDIDTTIDISAPSSSATHGTDDPQCAQDHETCRTDTGGVVCAWAPACSK